MSPPVFCMSSGFGADFVWTIFCNVLISIFQRSSNICNINSNINIWRISQRCKLTLETSSASCFARSSDIFASEKFYCLIIVFVCLYFCICICLQCYFWSCSIYRGVFFSSLQDTTSSTNWHITFNVPRIDHKKLPRRWKSTERVKTYLAAASIAQYQSTRVFSQTFTPTCQYFYTDISVISVTFCNSASESMQVHWLSEDLSQVWRDTGWYWVGVVTDPLKELFISSVPRYWVRADVNKLGVCTKCKISSQLTRAQSPPLSLYIWWSCSGLFTHLLYYLQAKNKK